MFRLSAPIPALLSLLSPRVRVRCRVSLPPLSAPHPLSHRPPPPPAAAAAAAAAMEWPANRVRETFISFFEGKGT
ncbi:hypothetical protein ACMD2_04448 [Ananas comosus]|uniref:Uncharacterized protein n=1 Tax=Ananas comosus TaxID=4615 RepID=A0A199VPC3_ANACO|nr:hypothetical protein ACMD2_04448 [Ananas comosus]